MNVINSRIFENVVGNYLEEEDPLKRVIRVNESVYNETIFDSSRGKFIAQRPHLIAFANAHLEASMKEFYELKDAAKHFDGSIQFGFSAIMLDENLALAHDVYGWSR